MAEDLIPEIMELIRPGAERKERCREEIGKAVAEIKKAHEKRELYLPVKEIKDQMRELNGALKKTERLLSEMNPVGRASLLHDGPPGPPWEREIVVGELGRVALVNAAEFASDLAFLIKQTGKFADGLVPPKAARRRRARVLAAEAAFHLIAEFASFAPTDTKNGRFFKLASKLFEAATGEDRPDLTRDCRRTISDYSDIIKVESSGLFREVPEIEARAEKLRAEKLAREPPEVKAWVEERARKTDEFKALAEKLARVFSRKRRTHG